jgi:non-ribosomal peptide synthetase component E (peptide arylation enzyme)
MSLTEVIPIIESLPHPDKFKLMQFLLVQLAKEEGIPLQMPKVQQQDPLWDIIGMAEGEPKDIARQHDKYLYSVK